MYRINLNVWWHVLTNLKKLASGSVPRLNCPIAADKKLVGHFKELRIYCKECC